jgi:HSP20 family protein
VVTTELPGIDPSKLEISVLGDTLTLKGNREESKVDEGRTFHRRERGFGAFNRTVQLAFRVDGSKWPVS